MTANVEPWSPNEQKSWLDATRFDDVRWIAETGSTNADLLELAASGSVEPLVLFTDHQNAGRGRQQRSWHDEPGDSLLVSAMIPADARWAPLIPLATGLAALEALDTFLDSAAERSLVGLKWPNDVLASDGSDAKLAGILVEARTAGGSPIGDRQPLMVVIGMGLNIRWSTEPPAEVQARGTTLEHLWAARGRGRLSPSARNDLLVNYLVALDKTVSELGGTDGIAKILGRYRDRCVTLGRTVSFATSEGDVTGLATGLGDAGELLVTDETGHEHRLVSGDAHHRSVPG